MAGQQSKNGKQTNTVSYTCINSTCQALENADHALTKFWKLEDVKTDSSTTEVVLKYTQIYLNTTFRDQHGNTS